MMGDLFDNLPSVQPPRELAPGAVLLSGAAQAESPMLMAQVGQIAEVAPFRHMRTPWGGQMSAAMTGCGSRSWVTDSKGYRYSPDDPQSGRPWPSMPPLFRELAGHAAAVAGFGRFDPDSCLINRYAPGARMGLHQDRDERDFSQPIVSISLGLPALFLFGGLRRTDPAQRITLRHGDILVWGGPARLFHHGIAAVEDGDHPLTGPLRFNLTLRRAC